MNYSIITDTSSNLPTSILKSNNIITIPFPYYINGEENICIDTEKFDGAVYYNKILSGAKVKTSQINPQSYIDYMEPVLRDGNDILFIGMSSGISGSFHSAEIAAQQLKDEYKDREIYLVDTLGASLGEGIPVLKAVELKNDGVALSDVVKSITAMCKRMCQVFMVDDLMHLKRTGRISGAVAIVGTVFHIKPLLKGNENGQIVNFGRARGRKHAIESLAKKYDELVKNAQLQIVGIAHADCEEDALYLEKLLKINNPPKEILKVCYEPVTGSHVGPGALALFFESDNDVRSK